MRWLGWGNEDNWLESEEDRRVYNLEDSWAMKACDRYTPGHNSSFFEDALWYKGWLPVPERPYRLRVRL